MAKRKMTKALTKIPPCTKCRGACCEGVFLPLAEEQEDRARWFRLHGAKEGSGVYLGLPCSMLSGQGECSIYLDRPRVCVDFKVGGVGCVEALVRKFGHEAMDDILGE